MKKIETVEVAVFYCDVCGSKCGSSMTILTMRDKEFHACSQWKEREVMCRERLHDVAVAQTKDTSP